jgi:hypothetical protein
MAANDSADVQVVFLRMIGDMCGRAYYWDTIDV